MTVPTSAFASGTLPAQGGGLSDLEVQFGNVTNNNWIGRMVAFRTPTSDFFVATIVAVNTTTDIVTLDRVKPDGATVLQLGRVPTALTTGDGYVISHDSEEAETAGYFSEQSNANQRAYQLNQKYNMTSNHMFAAPGRHIDGPAGINETTTVGDGQWDLDQGSGNQILAMSGGQFNNRLGGSGGTNDFHFVAIGQFGTFHVDNTSLHSIQRCEIQVRNGGFLIFDVVSNLGNTDMQLDGNIYFEDSFFEGRGLTTDIILIDYEPGETNRGFYCNRNVFKSTNGFDTQTNATISKFYIIQSCTFLDPSPRVLNVRAYTAYLMIDCIWDRNQTTINFVSGTGAAVYDMAYLGLAVADLNGSPIENARSYVTETTTSDAIVNEKDTAVTGGAFHFISREIYTSVTPPTLVTTTYGGFFAKTGKHGYQPNIIGLDFARNNEPDSSLISLATDNNITETVDATALTNGTGIVLELHATGQTDPNPMILFHYNNGTGTRGPIVGDTLTNGTATGTVVDVIADGDAAVAGWAVVDGWNGVAFTNNVAVSNGLASPNDFDALADLTGETNSAYVSYAVEINGNNLSLDVIYDWLSAKAWQPVATVDAIMDFMINWFEVSNSGHFLATTDGTLFNTNRALSRLQGVWIHNYSGGGRVTYQTSDSGAQFFPPVTTSVTFKNMKDNSEVRVYATGTNTEIAGIEDATAGTPDNREFSWSSTATTVVDYVIHNFQPGDEIYQSIRVNGYTVPANDTDIVVQQIIDRNAEN